MESTGGSEARLALKFSGQSGMICITFISLQNTVIIILYATIDIVVQAVCRIFVTKVFF